MDNGRRTLLVMISQHSSLLSAFGLSATSTYDSYLPLIFGIFGLIWGHFWNVRKGRFWGHGGLRSPGYLGHPGVQEVWEVDKVKNSIEFGRSAFQGPLRCGCCNQWDYQGFSEPFVWATYAQRAREFAAKPPYLRVDTKRGYTILILNGLQL